MSLASRAAAFGIPASNSPATPSSQRPGSIPSWQQKRVGQALNVSGNDTASASPDQPLPDNSDGGSADGANSNTPKPAGQTAGSVAAARSGVASWASRNTTASISGTASAGLNINKSGAVSFGGKTGGLLSGISSKVLTSSSSSSAVGGAGAAAVSATAASPSVPAWKQKAAATAAASTTNTSGATPQSTGSSSSALSKFGSAASSASTSTTAASSLSASAGGSKWGANRAVASSTTTASTAGPSSVGSSNKFGAGKLGVGSSIAGAVGGKGPTTAVGPAAASSDRGSSDAAASAAPPAPPTAEEVALLRTELAEAKDTILRLLERCEALTIERDEEVSRAIEQYTSDRPVDPWMALSSRVAMDTTVLLAQAAATMGTGTDFDSGSSNSYSDDLINRIMSKSMEYTSRCAAASAEQRALAEASEVGWEWAAMGLRSQLGRHGGNNSSFDDGGGGGLDAAVAASIVPSDGGGGVGQSDLTPGIAQPRAAAGAAAAAGHSVPSASPAADAALPFATSGSPRLTAAQPPVVGSPRRSSTPPRPPSVCMATPAAADSSSSDSSVAGHAAVTSPVAHDPLKWILESSSPPGKQASSSALTSVPLSAEHLISGSTASADTILASRLDLIGLGTHASDLTATLASLDSIGRDPATGELTQEAVQALAELEASMQFGVEQPAVP